MKRYLILYKYLSILLIIGWYIYMIIDDFDLIRKYWQTNLFQYLALWTGFLIIYFIAFSITYWSACFIIELIKKHIVIK